MLCFQKSLAESSAATLLRLFTGNTPDNKNPFRKNRKPILDSLPFQDANRPARNKSNKCKGPTHFKEFCVFSSLPSGKQENLTILCLFATLSNRLGLLFTTNGSGRVNMYPLRFTTFPLRPIVESEGRQSTPQRPRPVGQCVPAYPDTILCLPSDSAIPHQVFFSSLLDSVEAEITSVQSEISNSLLFLQFNARDACANKTKKTASCLLLQPYFSRA